MKAKKNKEREREKEGAWILQIFTGGSQAKKYYLYEMRERERERN